MLNQFTKEGVQAALQYLEQPCITDFELVNLLPPAFCPLKIPPFLYSVLFIEAVPAGTDLIKNMEEFKQYVETVLFDGIIPESFSKFPPCKSVTISFLS